MTNLILSFRAVPSAEHFGAAKEAFITASPCPDHTFPNEDRAAWVDATVAHVMIGLRTFFENLANDAATPPVINLEFARQQRRSDA